MYAPVFILEPLLVSYYWGQTVGQYLWGIKIIRETDLTRCPLVLSFVRYYAKALLGLWSMIYMLFSRKHKAIHDYLAHTVVILFSLSVSEDPLVCRKRHNGTKTGERLCVSFCIASLCVLCHLVVPRIRRLVCNCRCIAFISSRN